MTTQFTCTGADGTFITYSTADANGRYNVPFTLIPNTAANLNVYLWDATDQEYDLIQQDDADNPWVCLLYTSPSPRDQRGSRMPSSA